MVVWEERGCEAPPYPYYNKGQCIEVQKKRLIKSAKKNKLFKQISKLIQRK